uniref:Uncharacterized protein n=1 Tax=Romanomermis culicivorax TaxID=13658 RepID=A0A915IGJ6_ROMCU
MFRTGQIILEVIALIKQHNHALASLVPCQEEPFTLIIAVAKKLFSTKINSFVVAEAFRETCSRNWARDEDVTSSKIHQTLDIPFWILRTRSEEWALMAK